MKSLSSLSGFQPLVIILAMLPTVAFFTLRKDVSAGGAKNAALAVATCPVDSINPGRRQSRKVDIYDQSLQLPIGSYMIPEGWKVIQDVDYDQYAGEFKQFELDIVGPHGELARMFKSTAYDQEKNVEQFWRQQATNRLQSELDQLILGDFKPSEDALNNEKPKEYAQSALARGVVMKYLEAPVTGQRNGQAYRGIVRIIDLTFYSAPHTGSVTVSFAISPAEQFPQMMQTIEEIDNSYRENPTFERCLRQIQRYWREYHSRNHTDFYVDENGVTRRMNEDLWMVDKYFRPDSICLCSYSDSLYTYGDEVYDPNDTTFYNTGDWDYIEDNGY